MMILFDLIHSVMFTLKKILSAVQRQILVILAIASYENNRKSTGTSLGSWEAIVTPLQIILFFILMRVGFSFLRGGGKYAAGGSTDLYFNIIIFISTGFAIAFLFRQGALKALSGLKLRAPIYYRRIQPIDVLLGLLVNDFRAISTICLGILGLVWYFTWSFRLDSPGPVSVSLLTLMKAVWYLPCLYWSVQQMDHKNSEANSQQGYHLYLWCIFATFELPEHAAVCNVESNTSC